MPELRWILIVAGLVLLAGLWWWETRRKARQVDEWVAQDDAAGRSTSAAEATSVPPEPAAREDELPAIRASRRERGTIGRNPPIVEIPDDVEPELAKPPSDDEFVPPSIPYRSMSERLDDIPEDLRNLPRDEKAEAEQRQPWVRTQPIDRKDLQPSAGSDDEPADDGNPQDDEAGAESEPPPPVAARQKIVALRLIAETGRWAGPEVIESLATEGLSYGKFSIYHRARDDGKTIFFVASMVEPGSFDLEKIDSQSFPGISVFAVIPGPVDAPTTFDMMLASARRLAERLGGHLQDEQGSTLTAQRILNLREELVHFEHLSRRVQKRQ